MHGLPLSSPPLPQAHSKIKISAPCAILSTRCNFVSASSVGSAIARMQPRSTHKPERLVPIQSEKSMIFTNGNIAHGATLNIEYAIGSGKQVVDNEVKATDDAEVAEDTKAADAAKAADEARAAAAAAFVAKAADAGSWMLLKNGRLGLELPAHKSGRKIFLSTDGHTRLCEVCARLFKPAPIPRLRCFHSRLCLLCSTAKQHRRSRREPRACE